MIVSCALQKSVLQREVKPQAQLKPKRQNSLSRELAGIELLCSLDSIKEKRWMLIFISISLRISDTPTHDTFWPCLGWHRGQDYRQGCCVLLFGMKSILQFRGNIWCHLLPIGSTPCTEVTRTMICGLGYQQVLNFCLGEPGLFCGSAYSPVNGSFSPTAPDAS